MANGTTRTRKLVELQMTVVLVYVINASQSDNPAIVNEQCHYKSRYGDFPKGHQLMQLLLVVSSGSKKVRTFQETVPHQCRPSPPLL